MRFRPKLWWILIGMTASLSRGQSLLDEVNFRTSELGGIRLQGISLFGGYSTSAYPQAGLGSVPTPGSALDGDATYGASFSVGWQHHSQRASLSLLYSGSYNGMVRYSGTNGYSQFVSLGASRKFGPKWTLNITGTAQDSELAQFIFQPTGLGVLSQTPGTFDDLAAAFAIGQFSNAQMAAALTGAPVLESPARSLLLGTRVLSYAAQASMNYAYSSRLSFHFASLAAGGQNRLGSQSASGQSNYVMPRSLGANAGLGVSYMLSPRTDLGLGLEENGLTTAYQKGYISNAYISVGRKMGMHWFLRGQAGGSSSHITQQVYGNPKSSQLNGGGSLGFRTYSHTLLATYARSSIDNYGFGAGTNTNVMGSWNWRHPGSRWGLFASYSQQQMRNTGFASLSGWQAAGGISQNINNNMTLVAQYVYLSNTGNYYVGGMNSLSIQSIRISLNWSPQSVDRQSLSTK